jgi:hypothetical protein
MLIFMQTCPWTVKIWTLVFGFLSDYISVPSANTERHRYVYGMVCVTTVSTVLPSVMFPTSNRMNTTSYILQSGLFLTGTYLILDLLGMHSEQHRVLVTYLLLCHYLTGQITVLKQQRTTLLYSKFVVRLNFLLVCILSLVCLLICPPVHMQGVLVTTILFLPEVLGMCVSAVHSVVRGLGDLYEEYMSEDARYKYD